MVVESPDTQAMFLSLVEPTTSSTTQQKDVVVHSLPVQVHQQTLLGLVLLVITQQAVVVVQLSHIRLFLPSLEPPTSSTTQQMILVVVQFAQYKVVVFPSMESVFL